MAMNPASRLAWLLVEAVLALGAALALTLAVIELKVFVTLLPERLALWRDRLGLAAKKVDLQIQVWRFARRYGCSRASVWNDLHRPDLPEVVERMRQAVALLEETQAEVAEAEDVTPVEPVA